MEYTFLKVDCKWQPFGIWSDCTVTCGGGITTRHRIPAQIASFGGKDCIGSSEESKSCGMNPCPGWTEKFFFLNLMNIYNYYDVNL